MPNTPIPTSFNQVAKNPYTYLLITVVSLLWFFVYSQKNTNQQNDKDCMIEKTELRLELKQERLKNDNLVNSILIKQGVIEKLTVITDSLNKKDDNNK